MPIEDEINKRYAVEAAKRKIDDELSRTRGYLDLSAGMVTHLAQMNQQAQDKKAELEKKKAELENMPGLTDQFGKFSKMDDALFNERAAGKSAAYDWLTENQTASLGEVVEVFEAAALAYRKSVGKPWLLQRAEGLILEWKSAALSTGQIAVDTWEAFRDLLLYLGKEKALNLGG